MGSSERGVTSCVRAVSPCACAANPRSHRTSLWLTGGGKAYAERGSRLSTLATGRTLDPTWERSVDRTALRNGIRPRTLTTTAGYLELRIPSCAAGRCRRIALRVETMTGGGGQAGTPGGMIRTNDPHGVEELHH
jgi:hypothetical protein